MPLFICTQCQCVENTALTNFHADTTGGIPARCSECDPEIGKWHGKFPKVTGEDYRKAHPEALSWFRCPFCGGMANLLCDGRIFDNGTLKARVPMNFPTERTHSCDNGMCRSCAKKIGAYHLNMGRKGCRFDTVDLCPLCQKVTDKPIEVKP